MKTKYLFAVLFSVGSIYLSAQAWLPAGATSSTTITRTGNVGIGTTALSINSKLGVGGVGNTRYAGYFYQNPDASHTYGMGVRAEVASPGPSSSNSGIYGFVVPGAGTSRGVTGKSKAPSSTSVGTAYGAYFEAGNAARNYGVTAYLTGSNNGIAIFGWDQVGHPGSSGIITTKSFAAFLVGDTYVSGKLGIGVVDPTDQLEVCGTIRSEEVKVEDSWCDYVFDKEYDMPTLEEEEIFINTNGHLLSFESEEEMQGEIQLGDVTKRQQETIEKLMLHVIELNKEIKALKVQVESRK